LESKKVVPVLDEAYTILALENYWPATLVWKWNRKVDRLKTRQLSIYGMDRCCVHPIWSTVQAYSGTASDGG
jgi:hypothetical protein